MSFISEDWLDAETGRLSVGGELACAGEDGGLAKPRNNFLNHLIPYSGLTSPAPRGYQGPGAPLGGLGRALGEAGGYGVWGQLA